MRHAKALLVVQSLLWVGLAASLGISAVSILEEGVAARVVDAAAIAYTPEAVGAAALKVLPILVVALAVSVACVVSRVRGNETVGPVDLDAALRRAVGGVASLTEEMVEESRRRKAICLVGGALSLACAVRSGILVYLTLTETEVVDQLVQPTLVLACAWLIIGVALLAVTSALADRSKRAEIEHARAAIEAKGQTPSSADTPKITYGSKRAPQPIRIVLVVIAVLAVCWGIVAGGVDAVANRANIVCTECIGLG